MLLVLLCSRSTAAFPTGASQRFVQLMRTGVSVEVAVPTAPTNTINVNLDPPCCPTCVCAKNSQRPKARVMGRPLASSSGAPTAAGTPSAAAPPVTSRPSAAPSPTTVQPSVVPTTSKPSTAAPPVTSRPSAAPSPTTECEAARVSDEPASNSVGPINIVISPEKRDPESQNVFVVHVHHDKPQSARNTLHVHHHLGDGKVLEIRAVGTHVHLHPEATVRHIEVHLGHDETLHLHHHSCGQRIRIVHHSSMRRMGKTKHVSHGVSLTQPVSQTGHNANRVVPADEVFGTRWMGDGFYPNE